MRTGPHLARLLRRCCRGEGKFASLNKDEVADVNQRVWQIRENTDGVASKNKVKTHDDAAGNAPVPKRNRNHAFALAFGSEPLNNETHRENQVSDQAENNQVTPIEAEETMFPADPGRGDNDE